MTMTTDTRLANQFLVIVNPAFETNLRPGPTRTQDFWSGSRDARTFYALSSGDSMKFLVVPGSDVRGNGMREPSGNEVTILRAAGLNPDDYRVWSISDSDLVSIQGVPSTDAPEERASAETPGVPEPGIEFPVGMIVEVHGYPSSDWNGLAQVVTAPSTGQSFYAVRCLSPDSTKFQMVGGFEAVNLRKPVLGEPAKESTEAEALRTQVEHLQSELRAARSKHERDIDLISETLLEEADRRDWCTEYEDVMQPLNESLTYPLGMPDRERDYEVNMTITYEYSVTVSASSEDEARDQAAENFTTSDLSYVQPDDVSVNSVELA